MIAKPSPCPNHVLDLREHVIGFDQEQVRVVPDARSPNHPQGMKTGDGAQLWHAVAPGSRTRTSGEPVS
jgi:hypothetical protein